MRRARPTPRKPCGNPEPRGQRRDVRTVRRDQHAVDEEPDARVPGVPVKPVRMELPIVLRAGQRRIRNLVLVVVLTSPDVKTGFAFTKVKSSIAAEQVLDVQVRVWRGVCRFQRRRPRRRRRRGARRAAHVRVFQPWKTLMNWDHRRVVTAASVASTHPSRRRRRARAPWPR